ncbi:hypothetical protein D4765_07135 [Subtercola vilae]|uniref:RiboL-PSP-HEPN domain-containing protein n=1 Tax=Subtercola vilae TaxID=2056433 RepID=A0A4T2C3R4_9MICO|nr:hypothetical protein D4765_07135 [Subtercola vilae]
MPLGSVRTIVSNRFQSGRKLDFGNANPSTLGADFLALGLPLVTKINELHPVGGSFALLQLQRLNEARNALIHDDPVSIAACRTMQPLVLETARRWRQSLDFVAAEMDTIMREHLTDLIGAPPW